MNQSNNQYQKSILNISKISSVLGLIIFMLYGGGGLLKAQSHLLLSEITLQTADAEFIEIFNPTNSVIALDNYYLADNQVYPYVPIADPPSVGLGDFIIQFPPGASINSGETMVVAINGSDFEGYYAQKADFEIVSSDPATIDMINIDQISPGISNGGEGIALFYWNGLDNIVQDVDLMNAGNPNSTSVIVDKSLIAGYLQDAHTIPVQDLTDPPGDGFSTKRILAEGQHELHSGGNGITGHDETSEDISITWDKDYTSPTPGSTTLTVSGIEELSNSKNMLSLYPNPASSEINLGINTLATDYKIKIVNSIGAIEETIEYSNTDGSQVIKIDLSNYKSGIYFIMLQYDGEVFIEKFVKTNTVSNKD